MAVFVDVLLGTDGLRDWVLLPDGTKYMLGATSMAKLVAELAPAGTARRALDAFVSGNEARVRVDVDRMFALLAPARTRLAASDTSLIPTRDRTSKAREGSNMADHDQATKAAIQQWAAHLEQHIALLNQHAKEASPGSISANMMKDEIQKLGDLIAWIERPSSYGALSQNSTYYGLPGGTPGGEKTASQQASTQQVAEDPVATKKAEEQQQAQAKEAAEPARGTSKMSFDSFRANTAMVDGTLRSVDATNSKIDRLVAAGKKFNHVKAKADLGKIASRLSEICGTVDLANSWLKADLTALSKNASDIAALFPADA